MTPNHSDKSSNIAEMDAAVTDVMDLHRQGKLDDVALAQFDERMNQNFTRLNKESAEQLAKLQASFVPPKRLILSKRYRLPALLVMFFIGCGFVLELTIGEGFIFAKADSYRSAMPNLFLIILLPSAFLCFFLTRADENILSTYPTWWVRWIIMFPLMSSLLSGMIVFSPLGWAALSGWAVGTRSDQLEAKVLSIGAFSRSSKSCDQKIKLAIDGASADICIEGRLLGAVPKQGDTVAITGRTSVFGVFVDEIRPK